MQILRQVKKYFPRNSLKTETILGQAGLAMVVGSGILGTTLILWQFILIQEPITQRVQLSLTSLTLGLGILLGAIATRFISQRKVNAELETHSEIDPELSTTPPQCQPFIQ
ncbi:putative diguanylate cyclase/phosphodiesterase (GGDEF & EAL s) with PAS/PAC sensors domain protein, partial [Lyngbya aestuarii BL J]